MKNKVKWIFLSILLGLIIAFTFMRTSAQLTDMLSLMTNENLALAVIMHVVYLIFIVAGFIMKKFRKVIFSALLLILSGTASVMSIIYTVSSNIIIFLTFFILTLTAIIKGELDFDIREKSLISILLGVCSLFFAFYYLHWAPEPLFINALFYSPLGIVNCPTMAAFCGILLFFKKPGSTYLEFFVAAVTVYFGFFGVMRLGAYVDIVLIAAGFLILTRLASRIDYDSIFYRALK